MLKKLLLILLVIFSLCLCACSSDGSDDITKPKINTVPKNWSIEEDSPYGAYDDDLAETGWGLIDYTDQIDNDQEFPT